MAATKASAAASIAGGEEVVNAGGEKAWEVMKPCCSVVLAYNDSTSGCGSFIDEALRGGWGGGGEEKGTVEGGEGTERDVVLLGEKGEESVARVVKEGEGEEAAGDSDERGGSGSALGGDKAERKEGEGGGGVSMHADGKERGVDVDMERRDAIS
ncbi:hypothetical protein J5N97_010277 [Dioscorea zingiberensis]|uniref:Uncharacterized protein n=1 Tax=Dioscorea zingiberensis TaxID=325984 RepID=A0A9D5HNG4_9LILI|nr:hypothetical protein J5N97_010277 [Dioscorea zingiberensis]